MFEGLFAIRPHSVPLAYLKIGIQYVTQAKFSIFMHACLNLVGPITQTDIVEHLLHDKRPVMPQS